MEPANDPQLSRLLREWQVEDAPVSLDAKVLCIHEHGRRFSAVRRILTLRPGTRKIVWATTLMGLAFLAVVTQAIPQTLKFISPAAAPPYTVDSEYFRYSDDGAREAEMFSTSYTNEKGNEVLLQRTIADRPLETAFGRTLDAILPLWGRVISPISYKEWEKIRQSAPPSVGLVGGCDYNCLVLYHWFFAVAGNGPNAPCVAGSLVGQKTILGYSTIGVMRPVPNPRATPSQPAAARMTMWMAPELGCFALRLSVEEQRPDGTFRLVSEKQALRVTLKP